MITLVISITNFLFITLLAFAVFFRRYKQPSHIAFFISMFSTAIVVLGDAVCLFNPDYLIMGKRIVCIAEAVLVASWLLFSISFARIDYWGAGSKAAKLLLLLSPALLLFVLSSKTEDVFSSNLYDSTEKILFLGEKGYIFYLILLLYSVVTIINLEITLRNSSGTNKWQIKYVLLGTGGIIALNIFYYSYALLYRSLNMNLLPVRNGVIMISALMIGYSIFRHKSMDVEIRVSRNIIYRSVSIFIIGFYLLGLGIIGEGMRYWGPHVGKNITTFLGFAGAILVLTILLSEQLRRKVLVFISKNFYGQKHDYKEQWLQFTQRISLKHSFDELLESIAEGFTEAIGARGASVWLKGKDNGEYMCVKLINSGLIKAKPSKDLIVFLQSTQWILNSYDIHCKDIISVSKEFIEETKAALIVPFFHIDRLIGFIVLKESIAGNEYNYDDYDLLKTLARQGTLAIINSQLSEELTEAKEMEAMGRLSSFIIHDLKNAASMLSLIVQNADEHMENPDFQKDAIRAVSNTSRKIKSLIGKLKNLPTKTVLKLEYADLSECVTSVVTQLNLHESSRVSFDQLATVSTTFDNEEIAKVVINLIVNALDAISPQGEIRIFSGIENNMAYVKISDNGCGMSADFIEKRLFRPFQTTKSKGLGIGLYQCKTIVDAHAGKLLVKSREGAGTDFTIYLPLVHGQNKT